MPSKGYDQLQTSKSDLMAAHKAVEVDVEKEALLKHNSPVLAQKASAPPPAAVLDGSPDLHAPGAFSTDLCDCCAGPQACQICLLSWLVPCFAHGIIADEASSGESGQKWPCLLYCFGWTGASILMKTPIVPVTILGFLSRSKLKSKYGIREDGCGDCCAHFWCHPCAQAQEIRHIRDVRALEASAPGPGGIANVTPDRMKLVSWEPMQKQDRIKAITSAYSPL